MTLSDSSAVNRDVQVHLKSLLPNERQPEQEVFDCGNSRPNVHFQQLSKLAGVKPKHDVETGAEIPWVSKDLRKTCATY